MLAKKESKTQKSKTISYEEFVFEYFFKQTLGYGFRCTKCEAPGVLYNSSGNLFQFKCPNCHGEWGFALSPDNMETIHKLQQKVAKTQRKAKK